MKSEPEVFSIEDLERKSSEPWDGVRNFQARNFMRQMKVGDLVLFYHSNALPPGVAGLARVSRAAHPDPSAWDPHSKYFDPKSPPETPRWDMVEVSFVERFPTFVSLADLKSNPDLEGMIVTQRSRLSVQPVESHHFMTVLRMAKSSFPGRRRPRDDA